MVSVVLLDSLNYIPKSPLGILPLITVQIKNSTDFEWLDLQDQLQAASEDAIGHGRQKQFLKKGYLHVMERIPSKTSGSSSPVGYATKHLVRRVSDPGIVGSWSRRWCVLSQTPESPTGIPKRGDLDVPGSRDSPVLASESFQEISDDQELPVESLGCISEISGPSETIQVDDMIHLLLYKDQSSFLNLQMPCTVVALDNCVKLCSIPTHSKSRYTFNIVLGSRDLLFYPDTSSEYESWLEVLQDALNLQDAYFHSPLKGLPKQKALRKDSSSLSNLQEAEENHQHLHKEVNKTQSGQQSGQQSNQQASPPIQSSIDDVIAGLTTMQRRRTLLNKKHSQSEEPVKVLNFKKLVT